MDALLTALIAAALAEWGDKTQLLAVALAVRYRQPAPVLAGIAIAAAANSALAAGAGALLHDILTLRALSVLVALALLFAGAGGLFRAKTPDMGQGWKIGAFATSATCFFLLEFGDKTQFITATLAAQYDAALIACVGATIGIVAANAPAVVMGERVATVLPVRAIRIGAAILFLIAGFVVAVNALRLV